MKPSGRVGRSHVPHDRLGDAEDGVRAASHVEHREPQVDGIRAGLA